MAGVCAGEVPSHPANRDTGGPMKITLTPREVLLLRLGLADQIISAGRVETPSPAARATVSAELSALDGRLDCDPIDRAATAALSDAYCTIDGECRWPSVRSHVNHCPIYAAEQAS